MSEVKDVKTTKVETAEVEIEEETKAEGVLTKAAKGLKKHGKKVAAFAAVATVGLIGYALGSKSKDNVCESEDTGVYYLDDHSDSNEVTED